MSATILIAEAAAVERIIAEGGLRSSFCRMFRGTLVDTADPTPRGDGQGFDDLLRDCRVVCMDAGLLRPLAVDAPNRVERERYRNNLLHKVASRQHVWLAVIDGGASEQGQQLAAFLNRMEVCREGFGAKPHPSIVTLIFTEPMSDESRLVVEQLSDGRVPSIAKVYVMFGRLQLSERRTTAIAAHNVWPICVARLLAHLGINPISPHDRRGGLYVWRTVVWGDASLGDCSSKYRAMLAKELIPSHDAKTDTERLSESLDRTSVGEFKIHGNPFDDKSPPEAPEWADRQDATELQSRAFAFVDESVFRAVLEADGAHVKAKRPLESSTEAPLDLGALARGRWEEVADPEKGLIALRRLKEGRGWRLSPLTPEHEKQREEWGAIVQRRRGLNESREHHRDAAEEVSIARRRHLSLAWRWIIAGAVVLFIGQFLFSALSPLRPSRLVVIESGWETLSESLSGTAVRGTREDRGETVYLVDCSGSMRGARFDETRRWVESSIRGLPNTSRFLVVFFNDKMHLMDESRALQPATESAKAEGGALMKEFGAWHPQGGTDPAEAVRYALTQFTPLPPPPLPAPPDHPPAQIILLTDGRFADPQSVLDSVAQFNEPRGSNTRVKVHAVAIDCKEAEELLKKLAADTGGVFRAIHVTPFDIFDPLGFDLVLAIVLAAGAIGVTLGALVPWKLEVWSGRRACSRLVQGLTGLRRDFGHVSRDTQDLMGRSSRVRLAAAHNGAANQQRALATRAYSMVEGQLLHTRPGPGANDPMASGRDAPLAIEDRRDLHQSLEVPVGAGGANDDFAGQFDDQLESLAKSDAENVRRAWAKLCEDHDPFGHGHLPSYEIEAVIGRSVERNLDRLLNEFMWKSLSALADRLGHRDSTADRLVGLLNAESSRPCLSGRLPPPPTGEWPELIIRVTVAIPEVDDDRLSKWSKELADTVAMKVKHSMTLDVSGNPVPNLGLIAVGFGHEELRVVLAPRTGASAEFDVTLDASGSR